MPQIPPRPGILEIVPYVPGNIDTQDPGSVVYLASNESPLGASPLAQKAYQQQVLHQYPEADSAALRQAIGKHYALPEQQIVCANGSERLIDLLARAYAGPGDEVLYPQYGFVMYPICARAAGAKPVTAAETDFTTDVDALLNQVTEKTRIVFVANPNNPTGTYISAAEMRRLRQQLPANILLVIDSAYAEYVIADNYGAGHELVNNETANVVVLHTFSKIYGLANLRLGWAYCPTEIADVLNRIRGSFTVSGAAQAAGIAALQDQSHTEQARLHNQTWLPWLSQAASELGLQVVPSVANFILLRFADSEQCQIAHEYMLNRGIILRPVGGYGLPDALRITVGTEQQNQTCIEALQAFISCTDSK